MSVLSFLIAAIGFTASVALLVCVGIYVWDEVICGPDPVWEREDQWT
jgi:hypothetical protein